jgi:lipid-A-disaccharide synthase
VAFDSPSSQKILIVAAEASSGQYAEKLLEELSRRKHKIDFFGVGTQNMESLGVRRIGKAEEMSVLGIFEILSKYKFLKSIFSNIVEECKKSKPTAAILMDYSGFNLRLARELHALNIPVLYYISPQIWAWRKGRVKTIKKYVSKMLVIFPFEKKFYEEAGVPVEFVGHPLLDDLNPAFFEPQELKNRRSKFGVHDDDVILGLMPGSRNSELKFNFPTQLEVAKRAYKNCPNLKILIMVAPTFEKENLLPYLEDFNIPFIMIKDDPFRMIHLADVVLATSGTATLMVGLLNKPQVIMYKVQWLTAIIAKLLVKGTRFFGLVNLILNKEVAPERFQEKANVDELSSLVIPWINDKNLLQQKSLELAELKTQLGEKGATVRVAQIVEEYLK